MQARTKRQREILDFIVDFIESHGYEPSYQQIANHCGVASKGGIARHIEALEKKGLLRRKRDGGSFNLEVFPSSSITEHVCEIKWLTLPAESENPICREALFVPRFLLGHLTRDKLRGMIVPDNAMADRHILQGDVALIERKSFARDGECVAAVVRGRKTTLGSYYRIGSTIEIKPSNGEYPPIKEPADRICVLGVFRGLLRPG